MPTFAPPSPPTWLSPRQRPNCPHCNGAGGACAHCHGSGRMGPVFSRSEAVRQDQEEAGHAPCFGMLGPASRQPGPGRCGEPQCIHRRACVALHHPDRFHGHRVREESIELLSRIFLNARGIELSVGRLTPFQTEVAQLVEQWRNDTPQVAILGAFSSGKSTLINRFLGRPLLPALRTPTTAVLTVITHGPRARGVVEYRTAVRLTLLAEDGFGPDAASIQAMKAWLGQPQAWAVQSVHQIDDDGRPQEVDRGLLLAELEGLGAAPGVQAEGLRRSLGRRPPVRIGGLVRDFEITFRERLPEAFDLDDEGEFQAFCQRITDPCHAFGVIRARCEVPEPRLLGLNFLDTAGLCSPVGFHKDVTAEILGRRPDKLLVLLDARRLDSPTNVEALRTLGRFVSNPDDYRQVTFGLTFWDLALRTHMQDDCEPELDFADAAQRAEANRRFAKRKREELAGMLGSTVGVPCLVEPLAFLIGLGAQAPADIQAGLGELGNHLERECSGWVGVEMWSGRWQAAAEFGQRLLDVHRETRERVQEAFDSANGNGTDQAAAEARRDALDGSIANAIARAKTGLRERIAGEKGRVVSEINALDSKKGILAYLDKGFWAAANAALNAIQEESRYQRDSLLALHRGARVLKVISLDRRLLGLDAAVQGQAKEQVTGFMYGLKAVWDFVLGSVHEFNEDNRKAARSLLRKQAGGMLELLEDAVEAWAATADGVGAEASANAAERHQAQDERRANTTRYLQGLQRKMAFLIKNESIVRNLDAAVQRFKEELEAASARVATGRRPDFEAVLFTEAGRSILRKGRSLDSLVLFHPPSSPWRYLEIRTGTSVSFHLPEACGPGGRRVQFRKTSGPEGLAQGVPLVPEGADRFEMRLTTMEGAFHLRP